MPSPNNCLPVYGYDNTLLYHAPIDRVPRLIELGRVRPLGTKNRVRALVATSGEASDLAISLDLMLCRPPTGTRFSHKSETSTNPPGVWTHSRRCLA